MKGKKGAAKSLTRKWASKKQMFAERRPLLHELYPHSCRSVIFNGDDLDTVPTVEAALVGRTAVEELRLTHLPHCGRLPERLAQLPSLTSLQVVHLDELRRVGAAFRSRRLVSLHLHNCGVEDLGEGAWSDSSETEPEPDPEPEPDVQADGASDASSASVNLEDIHVSDHSDITLSDSDDASLSSDTGVGSTTPHSRHSSNKEDHPRSADGDTDTVGTPKSARSHATAASDASSHRSRRSSRRSRRHSRRHSRHSSRTSLSSHHHRRRSRHHSQASSPLSRRSVDGSGNDSAAVGEVALAAAGDSKGQGEGGSSAAADGRQSEATVVAPGTAAGSQPTSNSGGENKAGDDDHGGAEHKGSDGGEGNRDQDGGSRGDGDSSDGSPDGGGKDSDNEGGGGSDNDDGEAASGTQLVSADGVSTVPMLVQESGWRCLDLQVLNVSMNMLRRLPDALCALSQLRVLWANGNKIVSLPEQFGQLHALTHLDLSDNCLEVLPEYVSWCMAWSSC